MINTFLSCLALLYALGAPLSKETHSLPDLSYLPPALVPTIHIGPRSHFYQNSLKGQNWNFFLLSRGKNIHSIRKICFHYSLRTLIITSSSPNEDCNTTHSLLYRYHPVENLSATFDEKQFRLTLQGHFIDPKTGGIRNQKYQYSFLNMKKKRTWDHFAQPILDLPFTPRSYRDPSIEGGLGSAIVGAISFSSGHTPIKGGAPQIQKAKELKWSYQTYTLNHPNQACHKINSFCSSDSRYNCQNCSGVVTELVKEGCQMGGPKVCGSLDCGQKGAPACPRGYWMNQARRLATCDPGTTAGLCQLGLRLKCNPEGLLLCI